MDIIKDFKMRSNTKHIDMTTLTNSIDELNKNIVILNKTINKLIKLADKDKKKK